MATSVQEKATATLSSTPQSLNNCVTHDCLIKQSLANIFNIAPQQMTYEPGAETVTRANCRTESDQRCLHYATHQYEIKPSLCVEQNETYVCECVCVWPQIIYYIMV